MEECSLALHTLPLPFAQAYICADDSITFSFWAGAEGCSRCWDSADGPSLRPSDWIYL